MGRKGQIYFLQNFQIYKIKSKAETIFEKTTAENLKPDNKKKRLSYEMPRHITVKLQNIKIKGKMLKTVRRKTELTSEE